MRYLNQFETDHFSRVDEPVMLNHEEQRQWNDPGKSAVRQVRKWPEYEKWERGERNRSRRKVIFGIAIIVIVFVLAWYAMCTSHGQ